MRIVFYMVLYGFLGYLLERCVNLVFLGVWLDNSVLIMPVQPMYGLGVVAAILIYRVIERTRIQRGIKIGMLMVVAIITTALSEAISGELYEWLYATTLWDYGDTFSFCTYPYVCVLPTSLFGVLSGLTVLFVHPFIKVHVKGLPRVFIITVITLVVLDFVYTYSDDFIRLF
jgi:uncharacterized membrane protein